VSSFQRRVARKRCAYYFQKKPKRSTLNGSVETNGVGILMEHILFSYMEPTLFLQCSAELLLRSEANFHEVEKEQQVRLHDPRDGVAGASGRPSARSLSTAAGRRELLLGGMVASDDSACFFGTFRTCLFLP